MKHLFCLAAVAVLLSITGVEARQNKKVDGQAVAGTHATVVAELQQVHTLLVQAKHDYDGHRASAAGHVHKALQAMNHNKTATAKRNVQQQTVNKPANTNGIKETQGASDTQLKEALTGLHSVQNQLASLPKGPKHAEIEQHLNKAIHELHTALKIK
jgi:hypothetical protein